MPILQELPEHQDSSQVHIDASGAVTPYATWVAVDETATGATTETVADVAIIDTEDTPGGTI